MKQKTKKRGTRFLALLLSVLMMTSLLPVGTMAAQEQSFSVAAEAETDPQEQIEKTDSDNDAEAVTDTDTDSEEGSDVTEDSKSEDVEDTDETDDVELPDAEDAQEPTAEELTGAGADAVDAAETCLAVSADAPKEVEVTAGVKYVLDLSEVFADSDGHQMTYELDSNDLSDYASISGGTLTFQYQKKGTYPLEITATCEGGKSVSFTLTIKNLAAYEGTEEQFNYDETDADEVTVYVTMSNDGTPLQGNDTDNTKLSRLKVTVPYFDLSNYNLDQFNRYGTNGGKGDYVNKNLIKRPTMLHLFIYLTERYYMGIPESECGKGTSGILNDVQDRTVNTMWGEEAYSSNGKAAFLLPNKSASTSMLIQELWGHDMNFMYFRNHVYPLMDDGWGATADYMLLSDNDAIDIAMFTDWNFYTRGAFCNFEKDSYEGTAGSGLLVQAQKYDTVSPSDGGAGSFTEMSDLDVALYDQNWEKVADVEGNDAGEYYIETLPKKTGTYYLLGTDPDQSTDKACYAPATATVTVGKGVKSNPFEGCPFTDLYYMDGDKKVQLIDLEEVEGGLTSTDYPTFTNLPAYKVTIPEDKAENGLKVYVTLPIAQKPSSYTVTYNPASGVDWSATTLQGTATEDGDTCTFAVDITKEFIGDNAYYTLLQTTGYTTITGLTFVGGTVTGPEDPFEDCPFSDLYYMDGDTKVQLTDLEEVEGGLTSNDYPTFSNLPAYKVSIPEKLAESGLKVYVTLPIAQKPSSYTVTYDPAKGVDWSATTLQGTVTENGDTCTFAVDITKEFIGDNAYYTLLQTTGYTTITGLTFVGKEEEDPYAGCPFSDIYYMDGDKKVQLTKLEETEGGLTSNDYPTFSNLPAYTVTIPEDKAESGLKVYVTLPIAQKPSSYTVTYDPAKGVDWSAPTLQGTVTEDGDTCTFAVDITKEFIGDGAYYMLLQTTSYTTITGLTFAGGDITPDISDEVKVKSVYLDKKEMTLNRRQSETLTATVKPDKATVKAVKWSTSDPEVATVKRGVVTAVGEGTADITVTTMQGGKTAMCHVTVVDLSRPERDEDGTYLIKSGDQLKWFADEVNLNNEQNINAKLTDDIDLSEVCAADSWTPIGTAYAGTFDGQGHAVKGLDIDYKGSEDSYSTQYVGLFGTTKGAVLKNVSVYGTVKASGKAVAAALCGRASDTQITNCHNYADITTPEGTSVYTAGLAAYADSRTVISRCSNNGTVEGARAAGIVAYAGGITVINCYNAGTVTATYGDAAGIASASESILTTSYTNCYNSGKVTADKGTAWAVASTNAKNSYVNCYYLEGSAASEQPQAVRKIEKNNFTAAVLGENWTDSCPLPVLDGQTVTQHVDADNDGICDTCQKTLRAVAGYSVSAAQHHQICLSEEAEVALHVESADAQTYNVYALKVTYDPAVLIYVGIAEKAGVTQTVTDDKNGNLTILGYGAAQQCGEDEIVLNFTGKAAGAGVVTVAGAQVGMAETADQQAASQAADAVVLSADAIVQVDNVYRVNLDGEIHGEEFAKPDGKYYIYPNDTNYDYTVTATMGGSKARVVTDKTSDGEVCYWIKNVNGTLDIHATRTPKVYAVTVEGSGKADVKADKKITYLNDYSFTVKKADGYTYNVTVAVDGEAVDVKEADGSVYQIAGEDVTGEIVVTVEKLLDKPALETTTYKVNQYLIDGVEIPYYVQSGNAVTAATLVQKAKAGETEVPELKVTLTDNQKLMLKADASAEANNEFAKNKTFKNLYLKLITDNGKTYEYKLTVTIDAKKPTVKVKQLTKANLFDRQSYATFQLTSEAEIADVDRTITDVYGMYLTGYNRSTGILTMHGTVTKDNLNDYKTNAVDERTSLRMLDEDIRVSFKGYDNRASQTIPVHVNWTIEKPVYTVAPINYVAGMGTQKVAVINKATGESMTSNERYGAEFDLEKPVEGLKVTDSYKTPTQYLDLTYTGTKSVSYAVTITNDTRWSMPVTIKSRLNYVKQPELTFSEKTLTLNTKSPNSDAISNITVKNNSNLRIYDVVLKGKNQKSQDLLDEDKITYFGNVYAYISASDVADVKPGKYTYTVESVKFSEDGEAVKVKSPTLTINVVDGEKAKVWADVSAEGKIDLLDGTSDIIYTPTKIHNFPNVKVNAMRLAGEDADLFTYNSFQTTSSSVVQGRLRAKEGVQLDPKKTYTVRLEMSEYTYFGTNTVISTKDIKVRPVVNYPKKLTSTMTKGILYAAGDKELAWTVSGSAESKAEIENIVLTEDKAGAYKNFDFTYDGDGDCYLTVSDAGRQAKTGKTYKLTFEVLFKGEPENEKHKTVTMNVTLK